MRRDPEARREYLRQWRARHPTYHRDRMREYREAGINDWPDQKVRQYQREQGVVSG